ncbi:MAG: methyltransferase domain-containing protein [Planctomycetes bacterium]|nr:methyltransferase domain-containing protein [Planctomycetota bacterium]
MQKETWDQIWYRKGNSASTDLRELNGYERTSANHDEVSSVIVTSMDIKSGQRVLDVGCGAGAVARALQKAVPGIRYVGTDRSPTLVRKHIAILGNSVLNYSADDLVFSDQFFDVCICYGVFLYFESLDYSRRVVNTLLRQAKSVFIGDLPIRSHSEDHLLFDNDAVEFILADVDPQTWSWDISPGLYEPYTRDRFNIALKRKSAVAHSND